MKKLISIIVLSSIATFNAVYLTIQAYAIKWQALNEITPLPCDINSTFSCSSVFTHDFSWIFWIPFPVIAMFVYPIIIAVALLGLLWKIKSHFKILFFMWIWGLLFNSYFIYHEILVSTYCLLCLACTLIIISIAVMWKIGMCEEKKKKEKTVLWKAKSKIKNIFK